MSTRMFELKECPGLKPGQVTISESGTSAMSRVPASDQELESVKRLTRTAITFYRCKGKRLFDAVASAIGLLVTSPLLLICAVAVRLDSSGPIFFRQRRIGQGGKPFDIVKFRTMVQRAEICGLKITSDGDSRITATGKWLRKTKLDELPQLFNVLRGEMSLVGPRPEVPEYVAAYDNEQRRVLDIKPGITGAAALAYVDEEKVLAAAPDKEAFYLSTLMPRKLELDLWYCGRVSLVEDLRLIFATLAKLFDVIGWSANLPVLPQATLALEPSKPQRPADIGLDDDQRGFRRGANRQRSY